MQQVVLAFLFLKSVTVYLCMVGLFMIYDLFLLNILKCTLQGFGGEFFEN